MSFLFSVLFPPPSSLFITAMSVISFASLLCFGVSEIMGKHFQYSKFGNAGGFSAKAAGREVKLSGKTGMLLAYSPALLAALASFSVPGVVSRHRGFLVSVALSIHFFKRIFEVLFIHKYSGHMVLDSAILITSSYFLSTMTMIYAQYLTRDAPEPTINTTFSGLVLFLVGICGNFYHHFLLSKLRGKDDKGYKIPKGGLFELVICPHYLSEITGFIGVSLISQTIYAWSFTLGSTCYLMGRSYATRNWYMSKFDNFPRNVKAMIPYIF